MKILLLDPDRNSARSLEHLLAEHSVWAAHGPAEGLRLLRQGEWNLILLDAEFAGTGIELLGRICAEAVPPVVLLSSRPSMDLAFEAIRVGVYDVLPKPPSAERLAGLLASLTSAGRIRSLSGVAHPDDQIVGTSPEMLTVFNTIGRAASSDATVLILGESGTGKEMVARTLHARSARASQPFVAINCAAIPENLLESELFGHEKGAFTGAIGRRIGRFERAHRGTLFLDEIGDMSVALQSKILRAIQEREIERVGGNEPVRVDVRVVAATNRDLEAAVREERFREDLYYRLAVVVIRLPTLRERGADLDLLAEHYIAHFATEHGRPLRGVADEVFRRLHAYTWPGNVRQLRNAIERAVVMCGGEVLLPQDLPPEIAQAGVPTETLDPRAVAPFGTLMEMERWMIQEALRSTGSNLSLAAQRLGIHRNTLRRKLIEHGLRTR